MLWELKSIFRSVRVMKCYYHQWICSSTRERKNICPNSQHEVYIIRENTCASYKGVIHDATAATPNERKFLRYPPHPSRWDEKREGAAVGDNEVPSEIWPLWEWGGGQESGDLAVC